MVLAAAEIQYLDGSGLDNIFMSEFFVCFFVSKRVIVGLVCGQQ